MGILGFSPKYFWKRESSGRGDNEIPVGILLLQTVLTDCKDRYSKYFYSPIILGLVVSFSSGINILSLLIIKIVLCLLKNFFRSKIPATMLSYLANTFSIVSDCSTLTKSKDTLAKMLSVGKHRVHFSR